MKCLVVHYIAGDDGCLGIFGEGIEVVNDLVLLVGAKDEVDAFNLGDLCGFELCITTRDDDECVGVASCAALDHLSAFAVGFLCDGACVDDVDVSDFVEGHSVKASCGHASAHFGGFAEVEFASKCMEGGFFVLEYRCINHWL